MKKSVLATAILGMGIVMALKTGAPQIIQSRKQAKEKKAIKNAQDIAALNKAAARRVRRNQKRLEHWQGVGASNKVEMF